MSYFDSTCVYYHSFFKLKLDLQCRTGKTFFDKKYWAENQKVTRFYKQFFSIYLIPHKPNSTHTTVHTYHTPHVPHSTHKFNTYRIPHIQQPTQKTLHTYFFLYSTHHIPHLLLSTHTTFKSSCVPSKFFNSRMQALKWFLSISSAQRLAASWWFLVVVVWTAVRSIVGVLSRKP